MKTGITKKKATKDTVPFVLVDTFNIWNKLKLDTVTGRVWQIQTGKDSFSVAINEKSLLAAGAKPTVGRFTLVPTENYFTFILLDQQDGGSWQIQWSVKGKAYRWIRSLDATKAAKAMKATAAGK